MGTLCRWVCALAALAASSALAQTAPANPPNQAGTVVLVEGDARIVPAAAAPHPVKIGEAVSEGDLLVTGKDGEVHLTMQDSGFIALRANTRFRIVSYKADGGDDDKGIFRLLEGGFRSVTGWIGKFNTRGYQVRTASATIGIRGTDHEPRYVPEGSTEGEAGTYDRVYVGQTYIETPSGKAAIAPDQAGFVSIRPRQRPRLLAKIPAFFRPGPHEAEIARKHAEIQKIIDQRREERRKAVAEKRAALGAARAQAQSLRQQNVEAMKRQMTEAKAERKETREKREALQGEVKAARESLKQVEEKRKALQEDLKAGRLSRKELLDRRKALQQENQAAQHKLESAQQGLKALEDSTNAREEQRIKATAERQNAMRERREGVLGKRKALEEEQESAREEIKGLRQQENQRYREELKADRKLGRKPPAAPEGDKSN